MFRMIPSFSGNCDNNIGKNVKIIGIHVENDSFDEDWPFITWVKRVSGMSTGGTPSRHLGHSLLKREGVRSTLLQVRQVMNKAKNHEKIMISKNHVGSS